MTISEENERLTRVGPGTPGGDLLRRYWQPVGLSRDLADAPLPVRVLGEDLVLFRDAAGRPGLLGLYCPHRCVDLSYGRVEDGGLRCLYHGWLFDVTGRCLEQPAEPADSRYKDEVRHLAYPCREAAGTIFAYLGPMDTKTGLPPLFPAFHFLSAPDTHVHATKVHHECSYLQANEGNMDPAHLSFLHSFRKAQAERGEYSRGVQETLINDNHPKIEIERTRFGVRIFAERRSGDGRKLVRVTNYVFPNLGFFSGEDLRAGPGGYSVHWHVPIDDTSHWRYDFTYHATKPLDKEQLRAKAADLVGPDYRPFRNPGNRFLQDREEQKTFSFSGMGNRFPAHDLFAVQSPGPILDRTKEHLGTTDIAIVAARRMMLNAMKDAAAGKDPPLVIRDEDQNRFNDLVVMAIELPVDADHRAHCASIVQTEDYHEMRALKVANLDV